MPWQVGSEAIGKMVELVLEARCATAGARSMDEYQLRHNDAPVCGRSTRTLPGH